MIPLKVDLIEWVLNMHLMENWYVEVAYTI
jgi:hypothetical protein